MIRVKRMNWVIPYEIYPFDLMVSIGETDEQLAKALRNKCREEDVTDEDIELLRMRGQGRTVMLTGGQTVLRMKHVPRCAEQFSYLQHEIFHAVHFLFDRIGIHLLMNYSDEAFTYMVAYLTRKIYQELEPFNKP